MQERIETITINNVEYVRKDSVESTEKPSDEVIVRTYSAGVHIGEIVSTDGTIVILKNSRRLWKWAGAFTLNEVSTLGVDRKNSRISKPALGVTLQWIEIIPVVEGVDLSTTEK